MASIFTKIINGDIPSYKIAEDDRFYAFLDINPLVKGHTLVVPKQEIDYLFDLPQDLLGDMMIFSQTIAKAIDKAIPCNRVGVMVVGDEVPHAHIHLIPFNTAEEMDITRKKLSFSNDEFEETAQSIRQYLSK
jgi:histidine triad (HIT) family protein